MTSLQRVAVSAGAGDRCGLLVWCGILSVIASSSSPTTSARLFLLHLTMADMLGTSGEVYTRLINLAENGTCLSTLQNVSVLECF